MAAAAVTVILNHGDRACPAGALLCDGGENCTHTSAKSPRSPHLSPRFSPRRSPRKDDSGDGMLDMGPSLNYLVDGEGNEALEEGGPDGDTEIIQELYHKVKQSKHHMDNYLFLLAFILLTVLYLSILYLQADSFNTYQVSTAHMSLLPDGLTGDGEFTFPTTQAVYDWLNEGIVKEIWAEPDCGNGICERPDEFQAFGRFGCPSDCGSSANLSTIIVTFQLSFDSDANRLESNWNLCLEYPTALCWFEEAVVFDSLLGTNETVMLIPDGNWTLNVNAPYGGVVGSVVYNSTYNWSTPEAILQGSTLVQWKNCADNESETTLGICRQVAGVIAQCARSSCTANNVSLAEPNANSGLFIDLVGLCNSEPTSLDGFLDMNCTQIACELNRNSSASFQGIQCAVPGGAGGACAFNVEKGAGSRRLLQDSAAWSYPGFTHHGSVVPGDWDLESGRAERRKTLAELNTYPGQFTSTLWRSLGSTDSQRLFNLQAATQRALYSWVSHSCLATTVIPVSVSEFLAAFFCVYFGGPTYLEGCVYNSSWTNFTAVDTDAGIAQAMRAAHAGLEITREQEDAFVEVFLLALQSVTALDETTLVAFRDRMHQLDTEIVNTNKTGCPFVAQKLPWTVGQNLYSEIQVGDSITWVWQDEEPHSLADDDGLGDGQDLAFIGMGAGRLIVSRNSVCTPSNIGNISLTENPMPCVLQAAGASSNQFSFTKTFKTPGNYSYVDARNGGTAGLVVVSTNAVVDAKILGSLAQECAPGCPLAALRNGICNSACNNLACAYDGGDCSCSPNTYGIATCSCPAGQARAEDGSCCQAYGVGSDLSFPFSILTWGPNVTVTDANFLPREGPPLFRYVAVKNRVLVGMSLSQTRWASRMCQDSRFFGLFPNCTYGASTSDYGVNPVFLPKSVLYNSDFALNDTEYYANYSLSFDNSTLRNKQGIPYGFDAFEYQQSQPTFHYFLDLNLNSEQAQESLQYLQNGFFIDNATKSLTVELITFNGVAGKFTLFQVVLTFEVGGRIAATYNIQSVSAELYRSALDWFRFVLEIIFVCCVCWNILEEIKEVLLTWKREGNPLYHFSQPWNVVDFISLSIMVAGIALWTNFVITQANPFTIRLRYDIYDLVSWQSPGQYWNIVAPGDGFAGALNAFTRVQGMVYFRTYYVALQGINVLLMVLRILKLMDFQPRMGTITRTVAAAAPDLVHFFILFFIVFFGFAMYGHLVFGRTLTQFRTLPLALVTCFSAMLGNDSTNDFLMQLQGWELVAAVIFWWSYILIMVFIIFNLLIAIIVEAFMKVREDMEAAPSMPSEVLWIVRQMSKRLFTPLRSNKELLRHLRALGADKAAELAKYGYEGAEASTTGKEAGEPQPAGASQIIKIEDQEIDEKTLAAVFERASRRRAEGSRVKIRSEVDPQLMAKILFGQFQEEPAPEEPSGPSETDKLIQNVEMLKQDMAEMKNMIKGMVEGLSAMQSRSRFS